MCRYCRAWYLNDTRGGHGVGPAPICPVFHLWDGVNCEPIRCPNNNALLFPHCVDTDVHHDYPASCPPGQNVTHEKPYCHCPNDQEYTFPICHEPCPASSKSLLQFKNKSLICTPMLF